MIQNLRVPGPTPLPPEVLKAISQQMINHRGPSYEEIQARVINNLQYFFQTKNDIFLLTASGMGGLEAAVVNFFSPGDRLIFFTIGEFGNRWTEIARRFGADAVQVKFPVGKSVSADEVRRVLNQNKDARGVLITHNETATGVVNDIKKLSSIIKTSQNHPLILVDSISALGAIDLPMDKLEIDVLITASQKAWMAPPGIAMIAVSPLAWERHKTATMPRYYFDLSMYKKFAEKYQTPATCAVTTIYGLDKSLQMMRKEGMKNIFKRHIELTKYLRRVLSKIGLELFVQDTDASPTVTSIKIPKGIDGHHWLKILREKYKVILAGGMGETKGKIIRVAHMGWVSKSDIDEVIIALEKSLKDM